MRTYIFTMLALQVFAILAGLVSIARRTEQQPLTPTVIAVRVFVRLCFALWAVFLLAQGVPNV